MELKGGENMNTLLKKATVGIATGALLAISAVPSAFASTGVGVNGNGAFSSNDVNVSNSCSTSVSQVNDTNIANNIRNLAYTGGNSASFNTGGSVVVYTGAAASHVDVANAAGTNALSGAQSCSNGSTGVGVSGNGAFSDTNVDVSNWSREQWKQYNETVFLNNIYNSMSTGNNAANFNTGSDVVIYTGSAQSHTMLQNQAGANVLQ